MRAAEILHLLEDETSMLRFLNMYAEPWAESAVFNVVNCATILDDMQLPQKAFIQKYEYEIIREIVARNHAGLVDYLGSKGYKNKFSLPSSGEIARDVVNGKLSMRPILLYAAINNINWKADIEQQAKSKIHDNKERVNRILAAWTQLSAKEKEEVTRREQTIIPFIKGCKNYLGFNT